eukprot:gnl/Spiro4/13604_TR7249_c0_g1_i1.p1 gnl/Spiro4/13604_TR7249_c0_g1~~gnl/Spiro4/13604_TR7249_c0_g1_i1.p1  ORF type:complete len:344 (+),score=91.71 gnl/Spiro4/13604_TR7249_c0_g1_i1:71-1102(+)
MADLTDDEIERQVRLIEDATRRPLSTSADDDESDDRPISSTTKYLLIGGTIVFVILFVIFLFSWDALTPIQYGILYNSVTKQIHTDQVYEAGRHLVGPFNRFIPFPRTLVTIEFSNAPDVNSKPLDTRTREGLALSLALSFQYVLNSTQLIHMYTEFNKGYEQTFIRIARESILKSVGDYIATDWFSNRKAIAANILSVLQSELSKAGCNVQMVQLLNIGLPASWEGSIEETQIEQQNVKKSQFQQQAVVIRAQTRLVTSEAESNITAIMASASANATQILNTADMQGFSNTQRLTAAALTTFTKTLKFTPANLAKYMKVQAIVNHDGSALTWSIPREALPLV